MGGSLAMRNITLVATFAALAGMTGAAHAEHWVDTGQSDAFGLGKYSIDQDTLKKEPDGRYYYRVRTEINLGGKPSVSIDEYRVDCTQDLSDKYADVAMSERRARKDGTPAAWEDQTPSAGSGSGEMARFACFTMAKVKPTIFTITPGDKALCDAAKEDDADKLAELAHGANPNAACDALGATPLIMASIYDRVDTARALMAAGAKADGREKDGQTPLMEVKSTEMAQLLLDHGAHITARDKKGKTPLHAVGTYAMGQNSIPHPEALAELFLARGAKLEAADNNGETPLMSAAESGKIVLVQKLLDHGANAQALDKRGYSALDDAKLAEAISGLGAAMGPSASNALSTHDEFEAVIALLRERGAPERRKKS